MKKIIFSNLPMKKELHSLKYAVDGNSTIQYDGDVLFPVNAVLAKTLKKNDDVKVVLLSKIDKEGNSAINAGLFQKELNDININIGANIEYITIASPFVETRDVHEKLLRQMIGQLEHDAELICDITFGPKPLPIIMFSVMNFAEKFFKSKIKCIIYGKVEFNSTSTIPNNPVIYDLTPLYYLNSVTNNLITNSSDDAIAMLDDLLDL